MNTRWHRYRNVALGAAIVLWCGLLARAVALPPYRVVVITLDTTRADRLSPYGFMNVSLPHLERLAREGVVFDQATTVAPLTLPAHTSLFTGLLPPRHGVRDNADPPLPEARTTLAEILKARGFRTGAFVGSVVLDPDRGLKQGFTHYSGVQRVGRGGPEGRQRRAHEVVSDALAWLDRVDAAPFFLWAHLYDAHRPYDPPEPFASTYAHNPYVGEIAYADSQIGRLLDGLERKGLLDHTIVVIAADHGESLGERGERDHGVFIYENVIRVPLIIRAPGLAPRRVDDVVRLTDVVPTVLDLMRLPSQPDLDGISVTPLMHGTAHDLDLEAYAESRYPERLGWSALRTLRVGRYKFIDAPRPELYDLWRDPFEGTNIFDARRDLAATMQARAAQVAAAADAGAPARRAAASPELRDRLAALGYVAADRPRPRGSQSLPDPKDMIHLLNPDVRR